MLDTVALQEDEAALIVEGEHFLDAEPALAARGSEAAAQSQVPGYPGEGEDQRDDEDEREEEAPIHIFHHDAVSACGR